MALLWDWGSTFRKYDSSFWWVESLCLDLCDISFVVLVFNRLGFVIFIFFGGVGDRRSETNDSGDPWLMIGTWGPDSESV